METITDHRTLIDALGGNKVVADELPDCTAVRVGQWKIQNRIPVEYWVDIIALAVRLGFSAISSDWLVNTVRPRATPTAQADAA